MSADARAEIREALPECVQAISELIRSPATKGSVKVKAFEALADRGGLPAVKAQVTQTVSANMSLKELRETREELLEEQKQLSGEMKALQGQIEIADDQAKTLPQPSEE